MIRRNLITNHCETLWAMSGWYRAMLSWNTSSTLMKNHILLYKNALKYNRCSHHGEEPSKHWCLETQQAPSPQRAISKLLISWDAIGALTAKSMAWCLRVSSDKVLPKVPCRFRSCLLSFWSHHLYVSSLTVSFAQANMRTHSHSSLSI